MLEEIIKKFHEAIKIDTNQGFAKFSDSIELAHPISFFLFPTCPSISDYIRLLQKLTERSRITK